MFNSSTIYFRQWSYSNNALYRWHQVIPNCIPKGFLCWFHDELIVFTDVLVYDIDISEVWVSCVSVTYSLKLRL